MGAPLASIPGTRPGSGGKYTGHHGGGSRGDKPTGKSGHASKSADRVLYFSRRLGHTIAQAKGCEGGKKFREAKCRAEVVEWKGGAVTGCYELMLEFPDECVGLMVAGNSGRPGGACGLGDMVTAIDANHRTQEESVFSSWMVGECGDDIVKQSELFVATISTRYGLLQPIGSTSPRTIQHVDYMSTEDPNDFGDAWLVKDAIVCCTTTGRKWQNFDMKKKAPCHLVFAAGPNAGAAKDPEGSTARTLCASAISDYDFFVEGITACIRTTLDAMILAGVDIALIAQVSCGLYSGPHYTDINNHFLTILDLLLQEPFPATDGLKGCRANYFSRVIVPALPGSSKLKPSEI